MQFKFIYNMCSPICQFVSLKGIGVKNVKNGGYFNINTMILGPFCLNT